MTEITVLMLKSIFLGGTCTESMLLANINTKQNLANGWESWKNRADIYSPSVSASVKASAAQLHCCHHQPYAPTGNVLSRIRTMFYPAK